MSLYAVKNDEGKWLRTDTFGTVYWKDEIYDAEQYIEVLNAHHDAKRSDGYVVELVEAPSKVVVSGKESEILKKLDCEIRTKSTGYSPWKWLSKLDDLGMAVEDAYKALALGWEVEKPKRYGVLVPHVKGKMYFKDGRGNDGLDIASADCLNEANQQFTAAEIEQYGLGECERVEVTDDDIR